MTKRSDIHKSSFVIRHSSIPALPGWVVILVKEKAVVHRAEDSLET